MARSKSKSKTCDFSQMEDLLYKIDKLGDDHLKKAVGEGLKESYAVATKNQKKDIKKHNRSGETEESLQEHETVKWEGNLGYIDVGYDIENGGLPSVFLMYGTPRHAPNNPGIPKDTKMYNDIYGRAAKNKVNKALKQSLENYLNKNL